MKTTLSENDVNRVVSDAINLSFLKLPYDAQDPLDKQLAEHFLLRGLSSQVTSRLKKLDDPAKDGLRSDPDRYGVMLSKNYRREMTFGTPRETFDLDAFLEAAAEKFDIPKHQLKELAATTKKASAAPVMITLEYIGDVPRG